MTITPPRLVRAYGRGRAVRLATHHWSTEATAATGCVKQRPMSSRTPSTPLSQATHGSTLPPPLPHSQQTSSQRRITVPAHVPCHIILPHSRTSPSSVHAPAVTVKRVRAGASRPRLFTRQDTRLSPHLGALEYHIPPHAPITHLPEGLGALVASIRPQLFMNSAFVLTAPSRRERERGYNGG